MKRHGCDALIDLRDAVAVQARHPLLIAHRGGVITPSTPENSLAAIRLAAGHGYDMVEIDVCKPKDDEPVLFHDWTGSLLTNCGIDACLADRTASELTSTYYSATHEPIATLAQGLALCQQLRLGVMLDIKVHGSSPLTLGFMQRIRLLLEEYELTSAAVTISPFPLVREVLAAHVLFPIADEGTMRACLGDSPRSHGQFWFGVPADLPDGAIRALRSAGILVFPAINTHRYPPHAHYALAGADIDRLRAAGVSGFQIDAVYEPFFGLR